MAVSVLGSVPAKEIGDYQSPVKLKLFGSSIEPIAYNLFFQRGRWKRLLKFQEARARVRWQKVPCNDDVFKDSSRKIRVLRGFDIEQYAPEKFGR